MVSSMAPVALADNISLDSSEETHYEQELPSISASEFSNGCLADGSMLPDEFTIRPSNGISAFSTGGYNYVYKKSSTKILKRDAVFGKHPDIRRKRNVSYYYISSNSRGSANFSFGYGAVSVGFNRASTGQVSGYAVKSVSTGYTQLRIRGNLRETNYTVNVYDRYSGKFIRSYKENGKRTTESVWYDTVKA